MGPRSAGRRVCCSISVIVTDAAACDVASLSGARCCAIRSSARWKSSVAAMAAKFRSQPLDCQTGQAWIEAPTAAARWERPLPLATGSAQAATLQHFRPFRYVLDQPCKSVSDRTGAACVCRT